jgi:hypothetical protein
MRLLVIFVMSRPIFMGLLFFHSGALLTAVTNPAMKYGRSIQNTNVPKDGNMFRIQLETLCILVEREGLVSDCEAGLSCCLAEV